MATIRDVAKLAEVSVATVSRVINASGYCDKDTRVRVLEAVGKLGYQRNVHWSRLARNSSQTILFLLGNRESMNSMQMRMLVAAERTLQQRGYDLIFSRYSYAGDTRASGLVLPRLLGQPGAIDGVILAGLHHSNLLEVLKSRALPYVLLGNNFAGAESALRKDTLLYDDQSGVYEATRYLIRLGHQRIAFAGNRAKSWFLRRETGYLRAMELAGLAEILVNADWNVTNLDYGQLASAQLMRNEPLPTAIIAGNDEIAAGIWKDLAQREVRVPREVSLIGFGDRAEFSILEPSLTSVAVFEDQLGDRLAQMLLERLRKGNRSVPSESSPCKLIERHSCAPLRTAPATATLSVVCK